MIPTIATLRVDEVLKGQVTTEVMELRLEDPGDYNSCTSSYEPYLSLGRVIVMLGDLRHEGQYQAPRAWPPLLARLPMTGHLDSWLYRWVEYASKRGAPPAAVVIEGALRQQVGEPLQATAVVTNRLSVQLPFVLSRSLDAPVSVMLNVRGAAVSDGVDPSALVVHVPPESDKAVNLADFYVVEEEGPNRVQASVRLSAGDRPFVGPIGDNGGTVWRYDGVSSTAVVPSSWGVVKASGP